MSSRNESKASPPASLAESAEDVPAAELVRRLQAEDAAAEETFVQRYGPGLRALLMRRGADPALADDLHQETFALALVKIRQGELRNPDALASFLRALGKNLLIGHRRKEARYGELSPEQAEARGVEASQLRQLLASEEASQVRQLLTEMRQPRDRELLVRYYLTDDPKLEICQDLEVEPELFNRVLYRARQRLRDLWERSRKCRNLWRAS